MGACFQKLLKLPKSRSDQGNLSDLKCLYGKSKQKKNGVFAFEIFASHSGDIQVFVKRLVTSSVVLKEDKLQNKEYL